jgi:hypothetical protein
VACVKAFRPWTQRAIFAVDPSFQPLIHEVFARVCPRELLPAEWDHVWAVFFGHILEKDPLPAGYVYRDTMESVAEWFDGAAHIRREPWVVPLHFDQHDVETWLHAEPAGTFVVHLPPTVRHVVITVKTEALERIVGTFHGHWVVRGQTYPSLTAFILAAPELTHVWQLGGRIDKHVADAFFFPDKAPPLPTPISEAFQTRAAVLASLD